jgi:MFS family permease
MISIGSKIGMGSLGDRFGNRNIMIMVFILVSLAFLWLRFAGELWMLYFFAVIFGLGYGGFVAVQSPMVADYFGLKSHGVIFGLALFSANSGGALGSLVAGRIFDINGNYELAFLICAVLGIAGLILSLLLKSARKRVGK